ncbi:MAG: GH116 family glycosyl hydrolase [Melioribacteraceae bacterium]
MKKIISIFILSLTLNVQGQNGLIDKFELKNNDLAFTRPAQQNQYMDKIGQKAALLGFESGSFEMWIWPWKVLRNFEIQFFVGTTTQPIYAKDILRDISVTPEATVITYVYESFTVREIIFVPNDLPGAVILLDVNTTTPLTIVPGFMPVMQPQWPAGIGGQYSYWDDNVKAYLISESQQRGIFLCGSPAGKQMAAPPAHMFADNPIQFKIDITPGEAKNSFIPIAIAGSPVKVKADSVKALYKNLLANVEKEYKRNYEYYNNLRNSTVEVITPDENLNYAFEFGKVALNNLMVNNPTLGKGLVAGYGLSGGGGRPGFAWYFGGDAFINSFAMSSYGDYQSVKEALAFTQKWQRQENYPIRKKSKDEKNGDVGKMSHELSQSDGLIDWWNDYHYGYNHADTSPWYLAAMGNYFRKSGDIEFIRKSWKSIVQAYNWSKSKDSNGDGLMDLRGAGLGVLEFGSLVKIFNDNYTQSLWTKGIEEVNLMARYTGDKEVEKETELLFPKARKALEKIFWIDDLGFYSFGAAEDGKQVRDKNIYSSASILLGLMNQERSISTIKKFNESDMVTDWGVRNLSNTSSMYEPTNYNYGTIWPFTSYFIGAAQFHTHFNFQGYETVMKTARHAFDYGIGISPEVFSGDINTKLGEAYHDQGFSISGYIFPMMQGLAGLDVDALNDKITFAPKLPADWKFLKVNNIKTGDLLADCDLQILPGGREAENGIMKLSVDVRGKKEINFEFMPDFPLATEIVSASLNGKPVTYELIKHEQAYQLKINFRAASKNEIIISFKPVVSIYTLTQPAPIGATNEGLKIISQNINGRMLSISCEGKPGRIYELGVMYSEKIKSVSGADCKNGKLLVSIPGKGNDFAKHEIKIEMN